MSGHEHDDHHSTTHAQEPSHHVDHQDAGSHDAHHDSGQHDAHHGDSHEAQPEEAANSAVSEKKEEVSEDKEVTSVLTRIKSWVREVFNLEPVVKLTTSGPCDNPEGRYVGLSKKQMKKLKVKKGYVVSLYNPKTHAPLGFFVVGKSTHSPDEISFKANGVNPKMEIELKKISERITFTPWKVSPKDVIPAELPIKTGVENDKKHERRKATIEKRFGKKLKKLGIDSGTYIVIPTAYYKIMMNKQEFSDLECKISMGRVLVGKDVKKISIVPAGSDFGMTKKAEQYLGVKTDDPKGIKFGLVKEHLAIMADQ